MDRRAEVRHLNEADRHIADAERQIAEQEIRIERLRVDGHDTYEAERMLKTMQQTLVTFTEHRKLIVAAIEQIDGGLA